MSRSTRAWWCCCWRGRCRWHADEPRALAQLCRFGYGKIMGIKDRLTEDLKTAMRAKDSVRLDAIRSVRAAVTLREVERKQELDDEAVLDVIRGLRKQRIEAIEMFQAGERADLV